MRLLIWHCSSLSSRDIRRSNRPAGIGALLADASEQSFSEVLAAFVCIERHDSEATTGEAAKEIGALAKQLACTHVVLVPFAHLSAELMTESTRALELLVALDGELARAELQSTLTSFGFHKEFELHFRAKGHPGAVAFRELPRSPG
jgi:threonyl-tRNA synthetase